MATCEFTVELGARDRRFLRAASEVLKTYTLDREAPDPDDPEACVVRVCGKRRSYTLTFRTDWSSPPSCSCPDARQGGADKAGGFCKHAIAAALQWDDLRCQLLDLLI